MWYQKRYVIWGLIFAVNLILKGMFLTGNDIALDEPFSIFHSQQSLGELLELFPKENNPPLHYLLLHFVIEAFGIGPESVRLLSLALSSLAAVFIFRLGNRHFSFLTGIGASLIFTLSNFQIYHSHEARTYALMIFLTVMALDAYLRVFENPHRTRSYVWLGIWNLLLIYSHFLGFWLIMAQVIGILFARKKWPLFKGLLITGVATMVGYLPYIYILYLRMSNYVGAGTWVWQPHWTELYGNINRFLNSPYATVAFVLVLAGGFGYLIWKRHITEVVQASLQDRKFWLLVMTFSVIYFGMFAVSFVISPQFLDRYLLFTTVPLFLVMARAVELLIPRRTFAWVGIGVVAVGLLVKLDLNPSNLREAKAVAEGVRMHKIGTTPLVICPPYRDLALLYHYDREAFADYANKDSYLQAHQIYPVNSLFELPPGLLERNDTLLYLDADSEFSHPGNGIGDAFGSAYVREEQIRYDTVSLLRIFSR